MRLSLPVVLVTTAALVLVGCADADSPESEATSTAPATSAPAETPEPEPTEEPSPTVEPTEEPATEAPAPVAPAPTTDLPASVLLSQDDLYPAGGPRTEREGVEAWGLPGGCEAVVPDAVAMRTVQQGDGAFEDWVGYQQVAVFADVDAAVAAADRMGAVFAGCADIGDYPTGYASEPVAVGAQGVGLAVSYPGYDQGDTALGYFVSLARRGNAVTLVARLDGEADIAGAREVVTGDLQAAWEQLCPYDSSGC